MSLFDASISQVMSGNRSRFFFQRQSSAIRQFAISGLDMLSPFDVIRWTWRDLIHVGFDQFMV
jgi:hypothetical protein